MAENPNVNTTGSVNINANVTNVATNIPASNVTMPNHKLMFKVMNLL